MRRNKLGNLIVGIGGTGGKVIKALREHIARTRGEGDDKNHYLCMDTMSRGFFLDDVYGRDNIDSKANANGTDLDDTSHVSQHDAAVRREVLPTPLAVTDNEYIQLKGMSSETLNKLKADPYYENGRYNWLQADYLINNESVRERVFQFKEGAGQYRQIGRIGAFMTAKELEPWLSRFNNIDSVYVVCSSAGGTGAGSFIDIAAMMRHLLLRNNKEQPKISLLLLMPGAFAMDATAGDDTATYALLRELNRIQSPTIQGVPLAFEYEGVPRFGLDVNVFDQVTLLDYGPQTERARRTTVYPKIAEMLDLLTADGTDVVNSELVNVNKIVRDMQEGKDNPDNSVGRHELWKESKEPYYSGFDSFRFIIPVRPYMLKAAAKATAKLINALVGTSIEYSKETHHPKVFDWLKQMPGGLLLAFFGSDTKLENLSVTVPNMRDFISITAQFFAKEENKKRFMAMSANNLYNASGANQTPYKQLEEVLPKHLITNDRNVVQQKLDEVNDIRRENFGIGSLEEMESIETLRNTMGGSYGKALSQAITASRSGINDFFKERLGSYLNGNTAGLRDLQMILLGLELQFIQPMLEVLITRRERIHENLNRANQSAAKELREYKQCAAEKKPGFFSKDPLKECSEEYIEKERKLFDAALAYLSNYSLELQVKSIHRMIQSWNAEIDRVVDALGSDGTGTLLSCAKYAEKALNEQLDAWVSSDAVHIGFPPTVLGSAEGTPEETRGMYGFEERLYQELYQSNDGGKTTALTIGDCAWQVTYRGDHACLNLDVKPAANTSNSGISDVQMGAEGFKSLHRILIDRIAPGYTRWTLANYLDYLEEEYAVKRDTVAEKIAAYLKDQSLTETTSADKIAFKFHVVCPNSKDPFIIQLINDMKNRASAIDVPNYMHELTVIKMSAGYTESDYPPIAKAKASYQNKIKSGSPSLKIHHIFPEEINMAQFEQLRYKRENNQDLMLPPRLAVLFANNNLRYLFAGLFTVGLLDWYYSKQKQDRAYWCYANPRSLMSLLKDSEALVSFVESIEDDPDKYCRGHDAFRLNPPSKMQGQDGSDFFVAMARFVQRSENAQDGHVPKQFPFTIVDIGDILQRMEIFMNTSTSKGEARYELLRKSKELISPESIKYSDWHDEGKEPLFFARTNELNKKETKEFAEQLRWLFDEYYHIVKWPEKPEAKYLLRNFNESKFQTDQFAIRVRAGRDWIPPQQQTKNKKHTVHQNREKNHILWVDDRPENNVYGRQEFESKGIDITLALSTDEALGLLKKHKYSAIISDMGRKEGPREGYVLLETLRKHDDQTPFFILAGSSSPKHKEETKKHGGQGTTGNVSELIEMVMEAIKMTDSPPK